MWSEQISEYIDLTYHKNLEDLMNHGTEGMDAHTIYHLKGDVIWALGPKAKHEIMRCQWGRGLKDVNVQELLKLFKKTFMPARNVFHSRAQFFNVKQEDGDTLDEFWKRLVDIDKKCEFNRILPEEIITYKFAATINDKKARDTYFKSPLKLRTVLETIELDNYNRKYGDKKPRSKRSKKTSSNSSSNGEQVAFTKPVRKRRPLDTERKKPPTRNCHFCGKPNWTSEHNCPAQKSLCNICKKTGHFAGVCKSKTVNRIHEEDETDSNTESWPEVDHIQSTNGVNRIEFYKAILLVEGQPIEFIIDTGSPITIIPPIINSKKLAKTAKCFVDVNKNPIKFKGEALVEVKTEKSRVMLSCLVTENKDTQPLLGLDWLDKLEIGLQGNRKTNIIRNITVDERNTKVLDELEDLFKNNHTIEGLTIDIQLKEDVKPIQQKRRPVPIHFQNSVRHELEKVIEKGHLEKADRTTEDCFISAVITIKIDESVKIALDSRMVNESCIKRKAAMPNMEELISKISAEITKSNGEIWMSKIDLNYAYGQAKLSKEAAKHCVFSVFGGDFTGNYRFKKGFYGLSDIPIVFQEHID